ncbi:hypothetical protein N0V90_004545 [Kalmusia sp. IMI 367209]|nr:hypothetical protein N0V90_004545 [Kalmusia sp. IMI 367209]
MARETKYVPLIRKVDEQAHEHPDAVTTVHERNSIKRKWDENNDGNHSHGEHSFRKARVNDDGLSRPIDNPFYNKRHSGITTQSLARGNKDATAGGVVTKEIRSSETPNIPQVTRSHGASKRSQYLNGMAMVHSNLDAEGSYERSQNSSQLLRSDENAQEGNELLNLANKKAASHPSPRIENWSSNRESADMRKARKATTVSTDRRSVMRESSERSITNNIFHQAKIFVNMQHENRTDVSSLSPFEKRELSNLYDKQRKKAEQADAKQHETVQLSSSDSVTQDIIQSAPTMYTNPDLPTAEEAQKSSHVDKDDSKPASFKAASRTFGTPGCYSTSSPAPPHTTSEANRASTLATKTVAEDAADVGATEIVPDLTSEALDQSVPVASQHSVTDTTFPQTAPASYPEVLDSASAISNRTLAATLKEVLETQKEMKQAFAATVESMKTNLHMAEVRNMAEFRNMAQTTLEKVIKECVQQVVVASQTGAQQPETQPTKNLITREQLDDAIKKTVESTTEEFKLRLEKIRHAIVSTILRNIGEMYGDSRLTIDNIAKPLIHMIGEGFENQLSLKQHTEMISKYYNTHPDEIPPECVVNEAKGAAPQQNRMNESMNTTHIKGGTEIDKAVESSLVIPPTNGARSNFVQQPIAYESTNTPSIDYSSNALSGGHFQSSIGCADFVPGGQVQANGQSTILLTDQVQPNNHDGIVGPGGQLRYTDGTLPSQNEDFNKEATDQSQVQSFPTHDFPVPYVRPLAPQFQQPYEQHQVQRMEQQSLPTTTVTTIAMDLDEYPSFDGVTATVSSTPLEDLHSHSTTSTNTTNPFISAASGHQDRPIFMEAQAKRANDICRFAIRPIGCKNGDRCNYLHPDSPEYPLSGPILMLLLQGLPVASNNMAELIESRFMHIRDMITHLSVIMGLSLNDGEIVVKEIDYRAKSLMEPIQSASLEELNASGLEAGWFQTLSEVVAIWFQDANPDYGDPNEIEVTDGVYKLTHETLPQIQDAIENIKSGVIQPVTKLQASISGEYQQHVYTATTDDGEDLKAPDSQLNNLLSGTGGHFDYLRSALAELLNSNLTPEGLSSICNTILSRSQQLMKAIEKSTLDHIDRSGLQKDKTFSKMASAIQEWHNRRSNKRRMPDELYAVKQAMIDLFRAVENKYGQSSGSKRAAGMSPYPIQYAQQDTSLDKSLHNPQHRQFGMQSPNFSANSKKSEKRKFSSSGPDVEGFGDAKDQVYDPSHDVGHNSNRRKARCRPSRAFREKNSVFEDHHVSSLRDSIESPIRESIEAPNAGFQPDFQSTSVHKPITRCRNPSLSDFSDDDDEL